MKKSIFVALAVASLATAYCQESKPIGLSIRMGTFQPSVKVAKDQGKSWFFGGFDWKIRDLRVDDAHRGSTSSLSLSVDSYQKGKMGAIPVLLNWVHRNDEWYWTAGAGVSFNKDFHVSGLNTETVHDTRFAYAVGVGYDFVKRKSPLFAEVKYLGNSRDRLNGFAFAVGIRF